LAHNNLGSAHQKKGDPEGAIAEYLKAIRLRPDLTSAHINLARSLAVKGDQEGAVSEYREALRFSPHDAALHYSLGSRSSRSGENFWLNISRSSWPPFSLDTR
jgi:Flp pilus assembly protein TadD